MPNIAVTFRQEISRISRKEIRSQTQVLRKASAQYRRAIAELKRHASTLKSELARLKRRAGKDGVAQTPGAQSTRVRFSAKGVVSHRNRLGISAADYGKLIGVTGHTIYKWEHGTSRPRKAQLTALASVRAFGKKEALARLAQAPGKGFKRRRAKQ